MIRICQSAYDALIAFARESTDRLPGGVLGGRIENGQRTVLKAYRMANASGGAAYAPDRGEHSSAMSDMTRNRLTTVGTWFCHRDTDAHMTPYEIQTAHDRDGSYLVLSLLDAAHPVLYSYRVWGGRADKEELRIDG